MSVDGPDPAAAPAIRVLGDATPEEVAAVVAVLAAASGGADPDAGEHRGSAWASHSTTLRTAVARGPGAWRSALRP